MVLKNIYFTLGFYNLSLMSADKSVRKVEVDEAQNDEVEKTPYFTNPERMSNKVVKPAGSMILLKCKAGGNPEPNITWYKNGLIPKRQFGEIRYGPYSLRFEDVVMEDGGEYKCVVCNDFGCINHTYNVAVVGKFPK